MTTTKATGLGAAFCIGGYDLSADVNSLGGISTPLATLDVTGLDKFAHERLAGMRDGLMDFVTIFDTGVGQEHAVLSNFPRTDTIASYFHGRAVGNPIASINAKQIDYAPSRGADGLLTSKISVQADGFGLEWGEQLTAGFRTDTAATDGTAYDNGAATTFGCQVYIHALAFSGTDAHILVESASDAIFTTPQTEVSYAVAAVPTAVRVAGSHSSVNRYWRASTTTVSGFTSLKFAVHVTINVNAAEGTF